MNNAYPTGLDRGDGVTPLPIQPLGSVGSGTFGTKNPDGSVIQQVAGGGAQPPQERPDSPSIERSEQCTISHRLTMAWSDGLDYIKAIGRGVFQKDSNGLIYRVLSATLNSLSSDQSELIITSESISFDSPPDEFQCVPVDLGINILKNPRYSFALSPVAGDNGTYTTVGETNISFTNVKSALIRMIQTYTDSPFFPSADNVNGLIQSNVIQQLTKGSGDATFISVSVPIHGPAYDTTKKMIDPPVWDGTAANLPAGNYSYAIINVPVNLSDPTDPIAIAIAAAKEIISKLWRQEDTPYITGYQILFSQYFFAPTFLNPGGYVEDPTTIVPDFFMSPSQDGTDSIFDKLAWYNPQDYATNGQRPSSFNDSMASMASISSLRKADEIEYQRTWFKVTSQWAIAPIGVWDKDLYNENDRPSSANDYDQLI